MIFISLVRLEIRFLKKKTYHDACQTINGRAASVLFGLCLQQQQQQQQKADRRSL